MPGLLMYPTLQAFLNVLTATIGGPWEQQRLDGTWDNTTQFGRDRELHYPNMVKLSNGTVFPLTQGTDWCAIRAGGAYHQAAGWPAEWQLPAQMFYTPDDVQSFQASGMWIDGPRGGLPGDFIFFDWASDPDRLANHVGVVVAVAPTYYTVNEGNVGQPSVYTRVTNYQVGPSILGFGRPQFALTPPPPPTGDQDMPDTLIRYRGSHNVFSLQSGCELTGELKNWLLAQGATQIDCEPVHRSILGTLGRANLKPSDIILNYPGETLDAQTPSGLSRRDEYAIAGIIR